MQTTGRRSQTFGAGIITNASSTFQNFTAQNATTSQATTTNLAITGVTNTLLKTLSNGAVVAATAGVDYQAAGNYATFGYLFPSNATSTQLAFNGGATFTGATTTALAVTGSSTIQTLNLSNALTVTNGGTGSTTLTGLLKGNGTGAVQTALAGTDYQAPITATYPIQFSSNILSLGFGTTTANSFSQLQTLSNLLVTGSTTLQNFTALNATTSQATTTNLAITGVTSSLLKTLSNGAVVAAQAGVDYQAAGNYATFGYLFPSNATTTQLAFNGGATFAGATSTSFAVTGSTTIQTLNLSNALGIAFGGTGSTTLGGLLTGNGTGALTSATVTAPLSFSGNTLSIQQANTTQSGYLSGTDFTTFTDKISSTSLSSSNGYLAYTPATGVFTASTSPTYSNATSTVFSTTNLTIGSLTGLLKATSGSVTTATAGTDYQAPLAFTYPLINTANTITLGFGTTTSNTWGGTQTFTNTPVLGTLSGLVGSNNGTLYSISTSSNFVTSLSAGAGIALSGSSGTVTVTNTIGYAFPSNATSTALTFSGGLSASNILATGSTTLQNFTGLLATTSQATTTNLAITGITSSLLKTLSNGAVVAAVAGTDYLTSANLAYDFPQAGNGTSTLTQFNGGLTAYASSTIGNGTQVGGLTISGGATTTGNFYITGTVGIGTQPGINSLSASGNIQAGGIFLAAVGTASGPTYAFTNSSNTGLFNPTNALGFTVKGQEAARLTNQGFLGLGTTSPYANFSLVATSTTAGNSTLFAIASTTGGTATSTLFSISNTGTIQTALGSGFVGSSNGVLYSFASSSITAASSTLLGDTNTFSGHDTFTNALTDAALSGLIAGNNGLTYAVSTSSLNASITGSSGSVQNALTINNGGAGVASGGTYNGSAATTISYNSIGAVPTTRAINTTYPLQGGGALSGDLTLSTAFGTTTANSFSQLQTLSTLLVTGSTTLQNFTALNATTSQATTTNLAIIGVTSSLLKTLSNGAVVAAIAGTDYATPGSVSGFEFTPGTNYGVGVNSTSTPIFFTAGLQASSTSHFTNFDFANATGTTLAISSTTIANATINALSLNNALSVANGGTGSTTLNGILVGEGTSRVGTLVVGSGLTFDGTTLATAGVGITQIGPAGQLQSGGSQTLATTTFEF